MFEDTIHGEHRPPSVRLSLVRLIAWGVMHFRGRCINDNFANNAKSRGIAVWKFGGA
ncbi:hypothetical protein [Mesorhizobium australicum]|uniref:hypothetical protein n=1 Tax=Mesorhizobium australicum TaxID=536018 RepID=UPI003335EED8